MIFFVISKSLYFVQSLFELVMTRLRNLRARCVLQWVSSNFSNGSSKPWLWTNGNSLVSQNTRFYSSKRALTTQESETSSDQSKDDNVVRIRKAVKIQAQTALLDYFQSTRNLPFLEAESLSLNSPIFLGKLLKMVDDEADIGGSVSRLLSYNPINEFEPFLESLGLKPSEFVPLLPRGLVFLSDARLLLENFRKLSDYGFSRKMIGKVYVGATEVFDSDAEVLVTKLRAFEKLGLERSALVKFISSSPYLLVGDVDADFIEVLGRLKGFGFEISWIEGNLLEANSYNWSRMLGILRLFTEMRLSKERISKIISRRPNILFEDSGNKTVLLVGFLLKFGSSMDQISSVLMQFPQIQVGKFVSNLRRCLSLLNGIKMEVLEIEGFICSHAVSIGSCTLMKANSLRNYLNVGRKRLCSYILENPQELKNLVLGAKVKQLPTPAIVLASKTLKNKFLLDLGYVEDSDEMKAAQKVFRGKGYELQERFDLIMNYGLNREEVCEMVKVSPQILNQSKDVIRTKIDLLVKDLGHPISSLQIFPSYLNYTVKRVKLRLSMYDWLKGQGFADPTLALSTIIACSERVFLKQFVNRHPNGPQVWQDLRENFYSN